MTRGAFAFALGIDARTLSRYQCGYSTPAKPVMRLAGLLLREFVADSEDRTTPRTRLGTRYANKECNTAKPTFIGLTRTQGLR